ncbi:hypothetical protein ACOBQB_06555 [Streptomyces sp. G5(2025)]|uniref:hypothetical protein n=1 Tax=Streptomyces sp. G5(2025) TaxID=3406628 RepID=UPI003C136661
MTEITVIGAGKFAAEISRYVEDATTERDEVRIGQYLRIADEPVHVPTERCAPLDDFVPKAGARVVLAVSDMTQRRRLIDGYIDKYGLVAENIIHPTARVDPAQLTGPGNIIGPECYVGVNAGLGAFNVLNYHCTVGNHSRFGSNNFISPNFHCGNSVTAGDDNFFGLSCTVTPEISIGSFSKFQAGLTLFENAASRKSYFAPPRLKVLGAD